MPEGLQNGHEIKVEDAKPSEVVAGVPDFIQVTARTFPAMMENCCYWDDKRHFVIPVATIFHHCRKIVATGMTKDIL